MIKSFNENGEMKNLILDENGAVPVNLKGESSVKVSNDNPISVNVSNQSAIPVSIGQESINISQTSDTEVTLNSSIQTLSSTATTISIGKKVTMIMIANYSETSDVTMTIGSNTYQVGANLALELPMNINITNLVLTATESNTKIQLVVKGVE